MENEKGLVSGLKIQFKNNLNIDLFVSFVSVRFCDAQTGRIFF